MVLALRATVVAPPALVFVPAALVVTPPALVVTPPAVVVEPPVPAVLVGRALLVVVGGVFVAEALSVILQIGSVRLCKGWRGRTTAG